MATDESTEVSDKRSELLFLAHTCSELLFSVYETKIKVFDEEHDNPRVILFYGDILVPGMVVYVDWQQWTFSQPYGESVLNGIWTNTEGETKSVYRFLTDLIEHEWLVEIAFNPKRYIPKNVQRGQN